MHDWTWYFKTKREFGTVFNSFHPKLTFPNPTRPIQHIKLTFVDYSKLTSLIGVSRLKTVYKI